RHADLALDLGQHLQALLQAWAAETAGAGAISLVEAGLEDEVHAQPRSDLLQPAGGVQLQLQRFDHAGAGDQEQRSVQADLESAQLHARASFSSLPPAFFSRAARMKPMNSGWPSRGVDRNSGCAWQARNQGCTWRGSSTISTRVSSSDLAEITRPASSSWVR